MEQNPYDAPKVWSDDKGEPKRRLWPTLLRATASFALFVCTAAASLVFAWAFGQYPVMGVRIGAPSRPFLEMLMGLSCSIGAVTAIGALILAFVAWNGS